MSWGADKEFDTLTLCSAGSYIQQCNNGRTATTCHHVLQRTTFL
jgi:hypothetical protein